MNKTTTTLAALALGAVVGVGQAQATDNFLVLLNDVTDTFHYMTWENGNLIQVLTFGESFNGIYVMTWNPGQNLVSDVNYGANFYEPDGVTLSDTIQIYGSAGNVYVNTPFFSDIEGGGALTPLANAVNFIETGAPQTVLSFVVANGDTFTWQVASDVSDVPEPATWAMMLVGLGGLGALGSLRARRAVAAA